MQSTGARTTRREWARRACFFALAGLIVATFAAVLAPLGWPFELLVHFRPQYMVAAVLLAGGFAFLRLRSGVVVAGLLALASGWPGLPRLAADEPTAACSGPHFAVVTANLQFRNRAPERFLDWIAANPADVIVVQELTPDWSRELEALVEYPHRIELTREDPYGIAVLSRSPLGEMTLRDLAGDGLPSITGYIEAPAGRIYLAGLHTHWPLLPRLMQRRDRALAAVAAEVRAQTFPAVVAGDLNLTPGAPVFQKLLADADLRDSGGGRNWPPTWLAGFWPLALRIDHVLATPALCVEQVRVGPAIGSDHRPVWVRLRLRRQQAS